MRPLEYQQALVAAPGHVWQPLATYGSSEHLNCAGPTGDVLEVRNAHDFEGFLQPKRHKITLLIILKWITC